jgi:pyruvate formate lyase activating enzyme
MLLSGIKKTTLLDYPGKVSTIVFTLGCNFRCHYCHNYEFVLPDKVLEFMTDLISEVAFFNFLKTRVGFLDWVVISGWEPTIQKDLYEFVKKIKDLWFLVKLDTNWRDPKLLKKLIDEKLIDYVAMDVKYPFSKYRDIVWVDEDFSAYKESASILLNSKIDYEFRTTVVKWYHSEEIIREIWEEIKWAKKWYLQSYEEKNILNAVFDGKTFVSEELIKLKVIWSFYADFCEIRK